MPIDYEAEYNNRARVPEHPAIFARWTREAEDYRAESMKQRRAELGLSYGSSPPQFIDLFSPGRGSAAPLAVFVHGGYWQELGRRESAFAAPGFLRRGCAFAAVGYGLAPAHGVAEMVGMVVRMRSRSWNVRP